MVNYYWKALIFLDINTNLYFIVNTDIYSYYKVCNDMFSEHYLEVCEFNIKNIKNYKKISKNGRMISDGDLKETGFPCLQMKKLLVFQ